MQMRYTGRDDPPDSPIAMLHFWRVIDGIWRMFFVNTFSAAVSIHEYAEILDESDEAACIALLTEGQPDDS